MKNSTELYSEFLKRIASDEHRIRTFARRLLPDWEAVEDVMQDSYLVAWQKFGNFSGENFFNWMCVIVRFSALKHCRKHARSRLLFDESLLELLADEPEREPVSPQKLNALAECMKRLDARQKALVQAYYSAAQTVREIASISGKTENSIYKNLRKIRSLLENCIQNQSLSYDR